MDNLLYLLDLLLAILNGAWAFSAYRKGNWHMAFFNGGIALFVLAISCLYFVQ